MHRSVPGDVLRGALVLFLFTLFTAGPAKAQQLPDSAVTRLDIAGAVRQALDASRDVRDARLALEAAENQVEEAWGNLLPAVDFSSSYTRNLEPPVSFLPAIFIDPNAPGDSLIAVQFGADNAWNATVQVNQKIFEAAALIGVGAAGRFRRLQEEAVRGRSQAVVTQVRTSYYQLLLDLENQRLLENSVRRVEESLRETRSLYEAGLAPEYDVLRQEVELSNLVANLDRAESLVRQSRRSLAILLNLENLDAVEVEGTLATVNLESLDANDPANRRLLAFAGFDPREVDLDALVTDGQQARSDVRQLELTEELRTAELRVEQGEYLPRVSAFGTYNIVAQQNGNPEFFGSPEQRGEAKAVGLQVSVPLFQGLQRGNRVAQRRVALRQAETQTELVLDQAEGQIKSFREQVGEARQRALAQAQAVSQARRGFEIAQAQYREGLGSQLELVDAEVALRESEFNYAQAVFDFLAARARLDEAVGRVPGVDLEPDLNLAQ